MQHLRNLRLMWELVLATGVLLLWAARRSKHEVDVDLYDDGGLSPEPQGADVPMFGTSRPSGRSALARLAAQDGA